MYFGGRWEIPINSNPFYILNGAPDSSSHLNAQLPRAAAFVTSSLNWWRKIKTGACVQRVVHSSLKSSIAGGLEPDNGDMSQYPLQFGSGRVAKKGRDELISDLSSGHIIVICKMCH